MTEKESLNAQKRQLFTVEKFLKEGKMSLDDLDAMLPALFHINSSEDSSLIYCSSGAYDFLHIEKEELMPYSAEQLASILTEDTLKHITPKFIEFYREEDDHKVFAAFQQIVPRGSDGYIWVYTTTKIYQELQAPISISIPVSQMGTIAERLVDLLEEDLFVKKHYERFASLTKKERELIQLVVLGNKRKDIADELHISLHTYDTHRKNIRRKLGIKSAFELVKYAKAFGLVSGF